MNDERVERAAKAMKLSLGSFLAHQPYNPDSFWKMAAESALAAAGIAEYNAWLWEQASSIETVGWVFDAMDKSLSPQQIREVTTALLERLIGPRKETTDAN